MNFLVIFPSFLLFSDSSKDTLLEYRETSCGGFSFTRTPHYIKTKSMYFLSSSTKRMKDTIRKYSMLYDTVVHVL